MHKIEKINKLKSTIWWMKLKKTPIVNFLNCSVKSRDTNIKC